MIYTGEESTYCILNALHPCKWFSGSSPQLSFFSYSLSLWLTSMQNLRGSLPRRICNIPCHSLRSGSTRGAGALKLSLQIFPHISTRFFVFHSLYITVCVCLCVCLFHTHKYAHKDTSNLKSSKCYLGPVLAKIKRCVFDGKGSSSHLSLSLCVWEQPTSFQLQNG